MHPYAPSSPIGRSSFSEYAKIFLPWFVISTIQVGWCIVSCSNALNVNSLALFIWFLSFLIDLAWFGAHKGISSCAYTVDLQQLHAYADYKGWTRVHAGSLHFGDDQLDAAALCDEAWGHQFDSKVSKFRNSMRLQHVPQSQLKSNEWRSIQIDPLRSTMQARSRCKHTRFALRTMHLPIVYQIRCMRPDGY